MRLALVCFALLAVAASSRGGCGKTPYEPCAGKACSAACTECAPGDPGCVETAVVKACDADGNCAAAGTFSCQPADPCSGKSCGVECVVDPPCRSSTPPCMTPSMLGHCDAAGACVAGDVSCAPPPPDPCAGKTCGDSCNSCGTVSCMTLVATACGRDGKCVPATPWLCYDPCAGKACHDACQACPPDATGCFETTCLKWCDGAGQCVCAGPGAACP